MNEARAAKVGEKKLLILQTIAEMLERPAAEKVTTALLAKQLKVSEAAANTATSRAPASRAASKPRRLGVSTG